MFLIYFTHYAILQNKLAYLSNIIMHNEMIIIIIMKSIDLNNTDLDQNKQIKQILTKQIYKNQMIIF